MYPVTNDTLFKALKELEVLDKDALESAYNEANRTKTPLGDLLLEKDLIHDENLGKLIADIFSVPFVRLTQVRIDERVLTLIPEEVAARTYTIAFELDEKTLKIA